MLPFIIAFAFLFDIRANALQSRNEKCEIMMNIGSFLERIPPLPSPAIVQVDHQKDYPSFVHDVVSALKDRRLGMDSLEYFLKNLADVKLANAGEWVEFGCYSGVTTRKISNRRKMLGSNRVVHGFDSFRGLPTEWRRFSATGIGFIDKFMDRSFSTAGAFDRMGKPPFESPSDVEWHVGWFNETAGAFAGDAASIAVGNISFAHMDADLYISTAQAFHALEHRLAPGSFLVFDELVGYPEYQEHEMKALYEMLKRTGRRLRVIGYPGPRLIESPAELRECLRADVVERWHYKQNALVQLE